MATTFTMLALLTQIAPPTVVSPHHVGGTEAESLQLLNQRKPLYKNEYGTERLKLMLTHINGMATCPSVFIFAYLHSLSVIIQPEAITGGIKN